MGPSRYNHLSFLFQYVSLKLYLPLANTCDKVKEIIAGKALS